jgi:hypothetical protein
MHEQRGYPFGTKAEFLGESKIERGLSQFRVYRAASNRNMLMPDRQSPYSASEAVDAWFGNKALHFTTQKNMAQEYTSEEKPIMLEQRGVDFLEDVQKLDEQGVRLMLFSHTDLIQLGKVKSGKVPDQQAQEYLAAKTFRPSEISPRRLRSAAEIIVLLPEHMATLPLRQRTLKKHPLKPYRERGEESYPPGQFHERIKDAHRQADKETKRLRRRRRRLEDQRGAIMGQRPRTQEARDTQERERRKIERELKKINDELVKRWGY